MREALARLHVHYEWSVLLSTRTLAAWDEEPEGSRMLGEWYSEGGGTWHGGTWLGGDGLRIRGWRCFIEKADVWERYVVAEARRQARAQIKEMRAKIKEMPGVVRSTRKQGETLRRHMEWFVRHRVFNWTAAEIAEKYGDVKGLTEQAVYKVIAALAALVDD